ncbi:S8 family peptidase [Umezawaea beigongshangensis]|uniref:S8 family peptidase n=1 Tax=Umezawaea beigongshangensis TaxID=2780383 RepID=UPI0018F12B14|nr:S8 family peptidase [Umezawaea beigongshangensis]
MRVLVSWRSSLVGTATAVVMVLPASTGLVRAAPGTGDVHVPVGAEVVEGSYLVSLELAPGRSVEATARALTVEHGGTVERVYRRVVDGFVLGASEEEARRLARDPQVAAVEADTVVTSHARRPDPVWNLDRVDQRSAVLDSAYTYPEEAGAGVTAYVVDTGMRTGHDEFGGRASLGVDLVGDGRTGQDCAAEGHGTHVAGTVGGSVHGLADRTDLVAVRVLDCGGRGTVSRVVAGVDWITRHARRPAVVNMSLGGARSAIEEEAVTSSIGTGLTYVVSAGNSERDACDHSPAGTPEAITVGASNALDERASGWSSQSPGSNYGSCVDVFAPGDEIRSAHNASDTASATLNGTSMAAPHVTGAAALVLSKYPDATPAEVTDILLGRATSGALDAATLGEGSPDRLLHVGGALEAPLRDFGVDVDDEEVEVAPGASATVAVTTTNLAALPQELALEVSGAPEGLTAVLDRTTVPAGEDAELTVSVAADADLPGDATLVVTGTGPYGTTRTVTVVVSVSVPEPDPDPDPDPGTP